MNFNSRIGVNCAGFLHLPITLQSLAASESVRFLFVFLIMSSKTTRDMAFSADDAVLKNKWINDRRGHQETFLQLLRTLCRKERKGKELYLSGSSFSAGALSGDMHCKLKLTN